MKYLTLPRTDLRVSSLCLGTADFGEGVSESDSFALLDQFFEAGGNFLDTAAIYAAWTPAGAGSSEKLLGKWLAQSGKDAVVATKGAHPDLNSMGVSRLSQGAIEADLKASLRHLRRETIELYWLHRDDETVPVEAILGWMEDFVSAGKVRFYGCSNWKTARIEALQNAAQARGALGFVANQPLWSLAQADLSRADPTMVQMDAATLEFHRQSGLAAVPYSSQANGFFSKLAQNRAVPAMFDSAAVRATNLARFEKIQTLLRQNGLSITEIALGFLRGQPFATVPIIGCKTQAQLSDSLSGGDVSLSAKQIADLMATPGSE